ncbi:hypothetical protein BDV19DRAFT_386836 [Aspergillus venezuelensis]
MPQPLHTQVSSCISHLTRILDSGNLTRYRHQVRPQYWAEALGHIQSWSQAIGAETTGVQSLDYRLREHTSLRITMQSLLRQLSDTFVAMEDAMTHFSPEYEEKISAACEETGKAAETTILQRCLDRIHEVVGALERLNVRILNPLPCEREYDEVAFEDNCLFDGWFVEKMYPHAREDVVTALGRGMSERRAIVKYRRRKAGLEPVSKEDCDSPGPALPHLPFGCRSGEQFQCQYCFWDVSMPDEETWHEHILKDLLAYQCVFPHCTGPSGLWKDREAWLRHTVLAHAKELETRKCPLCKESRIRGPLEYHVQRHLEELAVCALHSRSSLEKYVEGSKGGGSQ